MLGLWYQDSVLPLGRPLAAASDAGETGLTLLVPFRFPSETGEGARDRIAWSCEFVIHGELRQYLSDLDLRLHHNVGSERIVTIAFAMVEGVYSVRVAGVRICRATIGKDYTWLGISYVMPLKLP